VVRGEHRHPRRAQIGHSRPAGEVQHQIQIVDHQVQHNRHVGAPGLERGEPGALEVPDVSQMWLGGAEGLVEALDVAHLELQLPLLRRRHQQVRLRQGGGEGLFHQDRHPRLQGPQADLPVGWRGHGDGDGLHPAQKGVQVGERRGTHLSRHRLGTRRVAVVHPHQPDAVE